MSDERTFVCPMPVVWADIHSDLTRAWEASGRRGAKPPVPLILNGWVFTSDRDKKDRWTETVAWAKAHALEHLLPELKDNQCYMVRAMTTEVRLSFCSASYRDLWECMVQENYESILCPECGAVLQPTVERHEGDDKAGHVFAYIPSHDRADLKR